MVEYAPVIFFRVNYSKYPDTIGYRLVEYQELSKPFHGPQSNIGQRWIIEMPPWAKFGH